jgi:nondiscriminating aspartyl-tRNA synthetase
MVKEDSVVDRTLVKGTVELVGKKIVLKGWVNAVRDHGKITFIDLRDRSGVVQCVGEALPKVTPEDAVEIVGEVKKRPERLINPNLPTGEIEVNIDKLEILAKSVELPLDMGSESLNATLPVLLDNRALTLKHPKVQDIFKVQAAISESFRAAAEKLGCIEVFTPTIAASATEGGSEVFSVDYYGHKAFMIQSPQLYKQIAVGAFERVYLFSHAYRAEPSVTTRHLSESIQLDCEMAFIENFEELLDALELVGTETLAGAAEKCKEQLSSYKVEPPKVGKIPRLKMREAQEIIKKLTGRDNTQEPDLSPEDETEICKWALSKHGSDFVTITHFPTKKRAFYTHPDPDDPEYSLSYDLLFRGVEILSGSQRVHDYDKLVSVIKDRGMDPKSFELYLSAFKYGMPPEGGFSFGLERMTKQLLNLANIREASLFPRDMERVDIRLATLEQKSKKK